MQILVLIPVYNEADNIHAVLQDLRRHLPDCHVLAINDGSTDKTLNILQKEDCSYLDIPVNIGYSLALQTGYRYALERGYDGVIQFDGDGQHVAAEAQKLIDVLSADQADVVIGSRFVGKSNYAGSRRRRLGIRIFSFLIRIICRAKIVDPTSGFQAVNRRMIEHHANMSAFPQYPDANFIIELLLKGYKIVETPVNMVQRTHGVSMHHRLSQQIQYMIMTTYNIGVIIVRHFILRERISLK